MSQFELIFVPQLLPTSTMPYSYIYCCTYHNLIYIICTYMVFPLDINLIPQSVLDANHVLATLLNVGIVNFAESVV